VDQPACRSLPEDWDGNVVKRIACFVLLALVVVTVVLTHPLDGQPSLETRQTAGCARRCAALVVGRSVSSTANNEQLDQQPENVFVAGGSFGCREEKVQSEE
jgi:hypothetical protein